MQPDAHTSKLFDVELESIRAMVLEMGRIAEYQVRYAMEAVRTADMTAVTRVIQDEARVNGLERDIDQACTTVIAKRTPAGIDLRYLIMVYKTIVDLERIGDEAKKIALFARELKVNRRVTPGFAELRTVATVVLDMLRRSLEAFARLATEDVPAIAKLDLEVDAHFRSILRQLLTYMIEDPRTISAALDVVFIAKSLERIGDHAKNVSEYVVYAIKGKDVRHVSFAELEAAARA